MAAHESLQQELASQLQAAAGRADDGSSRLAAVQQQLDEAQAAVGAMVAELQVCVCVSACGRADGVAVKRLPGAV